MSEHPVGSLRRQGQKLTTTPEIQGAGWILMTDENSNDYFEHARTGRIAVKAPHVTEFDTLIHWCTKNPKYCFAFAILIFLFFIWLRVLFQYV
jgi:hypothetical protein